MEGDFGKETRYHRYYLSSLLTPSPKFLRRPHAWVSFTSLEADDAAVFVAPIKSDIANLAAILQNFGEVTGLCTNFLKSSMVPIRCGNLDLEDILEGIPAARASFPLRYLGLPLSVWSLRRRDFQHLEDKCAGRLPTWNGKLINMAGRVELVKSV
jgi:hypothetical protein